MALIHALMNLKEAKLVRRFDMLGSEKAEVFLANGRTITVFMAEDYIVGLTSAKEALLNEPKADYIVYNMWGKVTEDADALAKKLKTPLVSFGRFRHIVESLVGEAGANH